MSFLNMGGSRGKTWEEHKVGFTIYKPMGNTKGGEQIQQTNGASKDPKMIGESLGKGVGMRRD